MRVTHRAADTLIIEDAPDNRFGLILVGIGAIAALVPWSRGQTWLGPLVGAVFVLVGLKLAFFWPTTTHRFERGRGLLTMDSKRRWRSNRRRELRFDSLADVVLKQMRTRNSVVYWVEYVTTQGERIEWSGFTSSRDDKAECVRAAREFLGMGDAPPAAGPQAGL